MGAVKQYSIPGAFINDVRRDDFSLPGQAYLNTTGPQHVTGTIGPMTIQRIWQILWQNTGGAVVADTFWALWSR